MLSFTCVAVGLAGRGEGRQEQSRVGDGARHPRSSPPRLTGRPGTPGKLRLIIRDNYPAVNNYSVIKV